MLKPILFTKKCIYCAIPYFYGFASGQSYDNNGGAANMLCLPINPQINILTASVGSSVYGSEYQDDYFTSYSYDHDILCSVCLNSEAVTSLMVPVRKSVMDIQPPVVIPSLKRNLSALIVIWNTFLEVRLALLQTVEQYLFQLINMESLTTIQRGYQSVLCHLH